MHGDLINKLNYFPVGLGDKKFDSYFLSDKNGNHISHKNSNYENILIIGFKKNYKFTSDTWIGFANT